MSDSDRPEHREKQGIVNEAVVDEYVIDADFHLELSAETLVDGYVDDKRIARKVKQFGAPPEGRLVGGVSLQYSHHEPVSNTFHGEALTSAEIDDVMRDFGLDATIVTPTNHLPFSLTNYPKLSTTLARAYNEYLLDEVVDVDRGIYANLAIPYWEPDVAAAEINRMAAEAGIVGGHGYIVPELWGNIRYDPVLEALTEHDLPLAPHIGSVSAGDLLDGQFTTWVDHIVAGVGQNLIANVVSMITSGVFDRYPDLNVVWAEAGNQWIPYVANRLTDQYQVYPKDFELGPRFVEDERQYLEKMPREYVFENMYATTQPIALPPRSDEARAVLTACHAEETFVFSTDWPHHATDATNWLFETSGIDADLRSKIAHGNAEEAYRIPTE